MLIKTLADTFHHFIKCVPMGNINNVAKAVQWHFLNIDLR